MNRSHVKRQGGALLVAGTVVPPTLMMPIWQAIDATAPVRVASIVESTYSCT